MQNICNPAEGYDDMERCNEDRVIEYDFALPVLRWFNDNHLPDVTRKVDRAMIAAMAMQGILGNSVMMTDTAKLSLQILAKEGQSTAAKDVSEVVVKATARMAVNYADALINELNKEDDESES